VFCADLSGDLFPAPRRARKQLGHRQPVASAGMEPCGRSAHQQFPSGLQVIGQEQFEQHISMLKVHQKSRWTKQRRRFLIRFV
jgi:hypothetical protein